MSKPVTVTIDLSEIESYALINELENRNIFVGLPEWEVIRECCDGTLVNELEDRGYTVDDESENDGKWDIYALYELRRFNDAAFDKAFGDYVYEQIGRVL